MHAVVCYDLRSADEMIGMNKWLCGVMLVGMSVLACGKPGAPTKGPEAQATDGSSANAKGSCPEGMVRVEGNETLQPFCMGETEVSVKQFRRCVEAKACRDFDPQFDFDAKKATWTHVDESLPINYVDEEQARHYCAFVGGRLPTADEWIWALGSARGWTFPWGNELSSEKDWFCGYYRKPGQKLGEPALCPAKQHPDDRTIQGVYDMEGSADEIVGPNADGEYGIPTGLAPRGISLTDSEPHEGAMTDKPTPSYAGSLVTWKRTTGIRCAASLSG